MDRTLSSTPGLGFKAKVREAVESGAFKKVIDGD